MLPVHTAMMLSISAPKLVNVGMTGQGPFPVGWLRER